MKNKMLRTGFALVALAAWAASARAQVVAVTPDQLASIFDGRRPAAMPVFASPSGAAGLAGTGIDGTFAGRRPVGLRSPQVGDGIPEVGEASPAVARRTTDANWLGFGDAFAGIEGCGVVDRAFFRQPTRPEGIRMLEACLRGLSERYDAQLTATQGLVGAAPRQQEGILIVAGGAGSTAALSALRDALSVREGNLFGYPAQAVGFAQAAGRQMSSLQPVIDRCSGGQAGTAAEFVSSYGECLRSARNAGIVSVAADPSRAGSVILYTREDPASDLSGYVQAAGGSRLTLIARRQINP